MMPFEFRLRSKFEFDFAGNKIRVIGKRERFCYVEGCEHFADGEDDIIVLTTMDKFLDFCRVCIASEQGENKDVDLTEYGIQYIRITFDDRYFASGPLMLSKGEVYFMYEMLSHTISPNSIQMFKLNLNNYLFISKQGYIFLADKYCNDVAYCRIRPLMLANFSTNDKLSNNQVGYDTRVEIGAVQYAIMVRGVCHPYVSLHYRDIEYQMSLSDWNKLRSFCLSYDSETYSQLI